MSEHGRRIVRYLSAFIVSASLSSIAQAQTNLLVGTSANGSLLGCAITRNKGTVQLQCGETHTVAANTGTLQGRFVSSDAKSLLTVRRTGRSTVSFISRGRQGERTIRRLKLSRSLGKSYYLLTGFDVNNDGLDDVAIVDTTGHQNRWFIIEDPLQGTIRERESFLLGFKGEQVEWSVNRRRGLEFVSIRQSRGGSRVRVLWRSADRDTTSVRRARLPRAYSRLVPVRVPTNRSRYINPILYAAERGEAVVFTGHGRYKVMKLPSTRCDGYQAIAEVGSNSSIRTMELCANGSYIVVERRRQSGGVEDAQVSVGALPEPISSLQRGDVSYVTGPVAAPVAVPRRSPPGQGDNNGGTQPTPPANSEPAVPPTETPGPTLSPTATPSIIPAFSAVLSVNFQKQEIHCRHDLSDQAISDGNLAVKYTVNRRRASEVVEVHSGTSHWARFADGALKKGDVVTCLVEVVHPETSHSGQATSDLTVEVPLATSRHLGAPIYGVKHSPTRMINYVFGKGMILYDMSDPTVPVALDSLPIRTGRKAIRLSETSYISSDFEINADSSNEALIVFDVEGDKLIERGRLSLRPEQSQFADFVVGGDYIYTFFKGEGLVTIRIGTDGQPEIVKSTRIFPNDSNWTYLAYHQAGYVLMASWEDIMNLRIVNVQNPESPVIAGVHNLGFNVTGLTVHGDVAYLKDRFFGIKTSDLSQLPTITQVHTLSTPTWTDGEMVVEGGTLYSAIGGRVGIVNVGTPAAPTLSWAGMGSVLGSGSSWYLSATAFGHHIVGLNIHNGIHIFDASNPAAVTELKHTPAFYHTRSLALTETHVVIADDKVGLIAQPLSALGSDSVTALFPAGSSAKWLESAGNRIFAAMGSYGVVEYAVNGSGVLVQQKRLNTPGSSSFLQVVDDRLYVADGSSGILVLDLNNPENQLGARATASAAGEIKVVNNICYVPEGTSGVGVYNCVDPAVIAQFGRLTFQDVSEGAVSVAVAGQRLYVLSTKNVVYHIKIDEIGGAALVPVANAPVLLEANRLLTHENRVIVGARYQLHFIEEVGDQPRFSAVTPIGDVAYDVKFSGSKMYMSSGRAGLEIYE